jgi:hypothetical protein
VAESPYPALIRPQNALNGSSAPISTFPHSSSRINEIQIRWNQVDLLPRYSSAGDVGR